MSVPDLRWKRRDIKSLSLLAQVLASRPPRNPVPRRRWLVEDGFVTEGGSSSAFIITKTGAIVVRPLSHAILPGITRRATLQLAEEAGLRLEERSFTLEEAFDAAEAFNTSASLFVVPVVSVDGRPVANGRPGPLTRRLRDLYLQMAGRRRRQPDRGNFGTPSRAMSVAS